MSYPVDIKGISSTTNELHLHDFFSFCGKIQKIELRNSEAKANEWATSQEATVHFEKISAAKTALMLNGGNLDGASLVVTSSIIDDKAPTTADADTEAQAAPGSDRPDHIVQEDKPRAAIVAEYWARGYEFADPILQRAIDMDKQHGISTRFMSYLKTIDQTIGSKIAGPETTLSQAALNRGKTLDQKVGITTRANTYYERAIASPWGKKVLDFYTSTTKQVSDIKAEADRIKAAHKAHAHEGHHHPLTTVPAVQSNAPPADVKVTTGL